VIRLCGWLLLAASCGGGGAIATRPAAAPAKAAAPSASRRMKLDLTQVERGLHVRVEASGSASDVHAWRLGDDVTGRVDVLDASEQPLPFRRDARRIEVTTPATTVVLRYDVLETDRGGPPMPLESSRTLAGSGSLRERSGGARSAIDDDPRSTLIDEQRFRGVGDKILALPEPFDDVAIAVAFTQASQPAGRVAASSFGTGRDRVTQRLELPGRSLRRAVFLFGPGGRAELDALEGHDESAWLGYTAFDARSVSAEVAGFRGVLQEYFEDSMLAPATLFFTVDDRRRGSYRVTRTHSGVLVVLSSLDPFDAGLRLAVGQELVHAWIGERTWVGDATPGKEVESLWFQEGVARWVAREQLARVGLLTPDEHAAELNRLLAIVTTSRHASRPRAELVMDGAAPGVVPLLVARGALFATAVDARIRERSRGTRSFDDVVRALSKLADARRAPLPEATFFEVVGAELESGRAREDFDAYVSTGKKTRVPDAALGACFEPIETSYAIHGAGFDVVASRAAREVRGVDPKGPAAAAGLRNGDVLDSADVPDRVDRLARIEITRDGKALVITYEASIGARRGQGFHRRSRLSDEMCRKLALRR